MGFDKIIMGRALITSAMAITVSLLMAINANGAQLPKSLLPLIQQRVEIANRLSDAVAKCVKRQDTNHVVFSGCIDWHSSVHGHWALTAYGIATGNKKYVDIIKSRLNSVNIKREHHYLQRHKRFEMPYGRAWFLRLAIDYEKLTGDTSLGPMADFVMESLIRHYKYNSINPRSSSYGSASWALINMHEYAAHRKELKDKEVIEKWIRQYFLIGSPRCQYDWEGRGFMAVCTNWAWLAAKILPRNELRVWLDDFFRDSGLPKAIQAPKSIHHKGLNFSRAWGLWAIYDATEEPKYANAFAEHFRTAYYPPSDWRGEYSGVGHWVAQFGMFALQPLFGLKEGR